MCVGGKGHMGNLCTFSLFCCESKIALKTEVLKKTQDNDDILQRCSED